MAIKKLKLAVLISGRGSNMKSLVRACAQDDYPAEVAVVFSNNPQADGLLWAKEQGIPTESVDHKSFSSRESFEAVMQEKIQSYGVDMVCLAGFMRLLSSSFVKQWYDKMVNIHPSLLPAYKGLHTHERALADGVTESGCTVHFVRPEMDEGPVIIQRSVPVLPDDTPEVLAARVLEQEHIAYPEAIRLIATESVKILDESAQVI